MTTTLFLLGVFAFTVGAVSPFVIRPLLARIGALDVPNERSSHSTPTLRGGGLAPLMAWTLALLAAILIGFQGAQLLVLLVCAGVSAAVLGLVDDLVGLRAGLRLVVQLVIGLATGYAACLLFGWSPLWSLVIMVFLAGYINVANFMDGINGISGVHGAIAGIAISLSGVVTGLEWLVASGLSLAGAFLAFLPWNFRRPGLFLGDVGSYLLGAAIGVTTMLALMASVNPLLVISPLAVFIADTVTVVVRRFIRGEAVLSPHRTHVYQRLTDTGLSHAQVTLIVALFSIGTVVVGFATWWFELPQLLGWGAVLLLCLVYLMLPRWNGALLPPSPRAPLAQVPVSTARERRSAEAPLRWAIVGSSGFIGSNLHAQLHADGVHAKEISAPRLISDPYETDGRALARAARTDSAVQILSNEIGDAQVVVNAAGLAAPDGGQSQELWGANAYLPAVIAYACANAGVERFIHLSSAAVQGRTPCLDESSRVAPFSPYSRSKALGERAILAAADDIGPAAAIVVVRATSVQGPERTTTRRIRRIAASWMASVAAPGHQPSVVSSVRGLIATIQAIAVEPQAVPGIVLQPWEGLSVYEVMSVAGRRKPKVLPRGVCASILFCAYAAGKVVPSFSGLARRLEMMWFGQEQVSGWADHRVALADRWLPDVLLEGVPRGT